MNAKTAANYLLYIAGDTFDDLTNMKLNKLLYFAQGHYLDQYDAPLFDDRIEAWEHGPVIPSVYAAYKQYADTPIQGYDESLIESVSSEAAAVLFDVARQYGKYTASALRNMTHAIGSPWDQVYQRGHSHIEIPKSAIKDYFKEYAQLTPAEKEFKESDFIGYRDKDGILVLPKEWDDEAI